MVILEFTEISDIICQWKRSDAVTYTRGGNPKPPEDAVVRQWVRDAWHSISRDNIHRSIQSAGFANNYEEWHIAKHDVYGERFRNAWINGGDREVNIEDLEALPQPDDIGDIDDAIEGLQLNDEVL